MCKLRNPACLRALQYSRLRVHTLSAVSMIFMRMDTTFTASFMTNNCLPFVLCVYISSMHFWRCFSVLLPIDTAFNHLADMNIWKSLSSTNVLKEVGVISLVNWLHFSSIFPVGPPLLLDLNKGIGRITIQSRWVNACYHSFPNHAWSFLRCHSFLEI